jgi:hypothetical protein
LRFFPRPLDLKGWSGLILPFGNQRQAPNSTMRTDIYPLVVVFPRNCNHSLFQSPFEHFSAHDVAWAKVEPERTTAMMAAPDKRKIIEPQRVS